MKGQTMQVEMMIKLILLVIVFAGAVMIIIFSTAGLNEFMSEFCEDNPEWCGENMEPCVCCQIDIFMDLGFPFEDIDTKEYVWLTNTECSNLIKRGGKAIQGDQEEAARCGMSSLLTAKSGWILQEYCKIPDAYVSEFEKPCICCKHETATSVMYQWDVRWMCEENPISTVSTGDCDNLWLDPQESIDDLIIRTRNNIFPGFKCYVPVQFNMHPTTKKPRIDYDALK